MVSLRSAVIFCMVIGAGQNTTATLVLPVEYPPITRQHCVISAAVIASLCIIRLFQKKPSSDLSVYTWKDPLKIWNVFKKDYWHAFDEQVIGTLGEQKETIRTIYNAETKSFDQYKVKHTVHEARGIYGYYVFRCTLSMLKKVHEQLKPAQDIISLISALAKIASFL